MIGLDTNVLIRLLTGDDVKQLAAARAFMDANCSPESPAFVNRIVFVETVWVLESAYSYTRGQIADVLEALLKTAELEPEDSGSVWAALRAYQKGADFADALIGSTSATAGCTRTVSFDRAAVKSISGFQPI